jgi:uncharacterized protein
MKNINLLKEKGMPFAVRATLPSNFISKYEYVIDFLNKLGAYQIYISRLNNYNPDSFEFDINTNELKADSVYIYEYHNKIEKEILCGNNPEYIPFIKLLERIHDADDSLIACGFMKGSTAVSYTGDLYPCHRFVGINGFKFGDVYNGLDYDATNTIFTRLNVATKKCKKCWARFICKRGCIRDIAKNHGTFITFDKEYCRLMKSNIERALITYYKIVKNRPDFVKLFSQKEIEVFNIV